MASRSTLFQPGWIGSVEIKNRIVMPSMTTRTADAEGFVTDDAIDYYLRRAAGGVGLITVEMCSPEIAGRHRRFELGIHDDKFIPGLKRLVDALHAHGAKVSIQLGHGGGHTRIDISGEVPVAPSAIPYDVEEGHTETIVPEEMSIDRIRQAADAFGAAARRAEDAGFDIVEIHAAHGYLISQFFTPAENHRSDEYGGSLENRARLSLDVLRSVRNSAPKLGVVFRLNGDDYFPGGIGIEEATQIAVWATETGAHAISVTGGHYRSLPSAAVMIPPMSLPAAIFVPFAAAIRKRVAVPVIAVGRLGDPADAEAALTSGAADFVALGRPLLADPEWSDRTRDGLPVRMCLACNTCVDGMRQGSRLHCLVNTETGRERRFKISGFPNCGPKGKRIAVIGAGPAGLTYASLVAANNKVTVFEKAPVSGGAFRLAGLAPKFQSVDADPSSLLCYIASLEERCRKAGVELRFNTSATDPRALDGFDLVVIAAGAAYRAGSGPIMRWMLRSGLFRLPGLRALASNPAVRDFFYYKARRGVGLEMRRRFEGHVPTIVIGDAQAAGKSAEAIASAFEAAMRFGAADPLGDTTHDMAADGVVSPT